MKNAQLETLFDCLDNAVAMYVDARSGLVIGKCVQSLEDVIVLSNKLAAMRAASAGVATPHVCVH